MPDLTQTAANVASVDSAPPKNEFIDGRAGGTVTAGMPVYRATDGDLEAAQADASATAAILGVALHGASAGQPLRIQTKGKMNIGATVAVGTLYVVSAAAAGGIAPDSDLGTGNYFSPVCYGISTSNVQLCIANTQATHA